MKNDSFDYCSWIINTFSHQEPIPANNTYIAQGKMRKYAPEYSPLQ